MPVAVEMFLDGATTSLVRQVWKDLHDRGLASGLWESGARPHITLGIYEGVEYPDFADRLGSFAEDLTPFPVTLETLAVFPTDKAVVFLAPRVTKEVLSLKATFHALFHDVGTFPWEFYLPEHWVPHCALATDFPRERIPAIVEACLRHPLRIHGRVEEFGLVKFPPVEVLRSFPLGR